MRLFPTPSFMGVQTREEQHTEIGGGEMGEVFQGFRGGRPFHSCPTFR